MRCPKYRGLSQIQGGTPEEVPLMLVYLHIQDLTINCDGLWEPQIPWAGSNPTVVVSNFHGVSQAVQTAGQVVLVWLGLKPRGMALGEGWLGQTSREFIINSRLWAWASWTLKLQRLGLVQLALR